MRHQAGNAAEQHGCRDACGGLARQARNDLSGARHVPMREEVSGETVSAGQQMTEGRRPRPTLQGNQLPTWEYEQP